MSGTEMGLDIADTLCFQLGGARRRLTWRQFILALGLHTIEEMVEDGFEAYCLGSARVIPDKWDLRDYWIEISSDRDFLGPAPSYVYIRDPVRRLCHRMISCSISGRGQAPEKLIGMLRGGRVELGCLEDTSLGVSLLILALRNICVTLGDTWACVALGPERPPAAAAEAPKDAKGAHDEVEG
ncbi:hypothetical protein Tco_1487389 [Tanacetum coccineum]